jgi:nucleotide-binding universal stress UspA family protein
MYKTILAPIDLGHIDQLQKALATVGALAKLYGAEVYFVRVTGTTPSDVAHTPEEFSTKLHAFAAQQATAQGFAAKALPLVSHDPTTDLDKTIAKAVEDTGADLVVMGSHKPGLQERLISSNAGWLASHLSTSVFVVR